MRLLTPTLRLSLRVALSNVEWANVGREPNFPKPVVFRSAVGVGSWRVGSWLCVLLAVIAFSISAAAQTVPTWPQEAPPRPLPARDVKFPPYELRTLANGLQVIAVSHHEQPSVAMRLLVRAGAAQDPDKKAGVAYLTAHLLDQGTKSRSAEQVADDIDSIGGLMGTGSGADLTFANVIVMKDSFALGLSQLYDVVHNPAFAAEEIERQKEQAISSLRVNGDDPDYIASVLIDRLVFGFHPYGLPGTGTPDTLAKITRDDIQAFHARYFVPNNMILAVVGDVTSAEAFAMAEKVFGGWPRVDVQLPKPADPPSPTRRIVIIDKPDSVQTEIRVGQLAIPRKHADYVAWDLAVKILGGEGANRLHQLLRSQRGLTYGASADVEAMKDAGNYIAETDTRTETTGEALRLMVEEFSRLQRQRVFERELADAQAYLSGSFPLTIETPNEIATQILNTVFYDLPVQDLATYRERVLAVTADDVQRVAKQYIHPERLSIVLVGNARAFIPQLQTVGFTEYEIIPLPQLDLMSATLRRPPTNAAIEPFEPVKPFESFEPFESFVSFSKRTAYAEQQGGATGRRGSGTPNGSNDSNDPNGMALLRQVIDAKGGLPVLKGVRTVLAEAETRFQTQQGEVRSATKTYVVYPDQFRVDAAIADPAGSGRTAQVIQTYNSGMAWVQDPAGVRDAPPAMRDDFAASVRRDTFPMLIAAAEGRLTVRRLPDEGTGPDALRVLEIRGRDLEPVRLYINRDQLIARQTYTAVGGDGQPAPTEERYSDYRTVSGIKVPFQTQLMRTGSPVLTRTLTNVTFNGRIDPNLFARPR
jgi:zinc protease